MKLETFALILLLTFSALAQSKNADGNRVPDLPHRINIKSPSADSETLLAGKVTAYVFCRDAYEAKHKEEIRYYIESSPFDQTGKKRTLVPLIDNGQLETLIGAELVLTGTYSEQDNNFTGTTNSSFSIKRIVSAKSQKIDQLSLASIRTKRIAIIGAKFTDTTDPMPSIAALQTPFMSTPRSLYGYMIDAMRGSVFLQSGPQDIYGWYNLNFPSTDCNSNFLAWQDAATALAQADAQTRGIDLAHDYSHLIFVMPTTTCPFAGSARAGLGVDTPFQLRIIFPLISLEDLSAVVPVMPHEMGHTFGIWNHEGKTNCFGPAGGTCVRQNNGGSGTPMGVSRVIHYSPVEKALLGLIQPDKIQDFGDATGNTSVILYPHEWGGKGKQLAIRKIPGTDEWVYLSVNSTSNAGYNITGGHLSEVHVRIGTSIANNMQLYLVDATPQTPDNWFDAGLRPGMSMQYSTVPNFSVRNDGIAWSIYGKGVRVTFVHTP